MDTGRVETIAHVTPWSVEAIADNLGITVTEPWLVQVTADSITLLRPCRAVARSIVIPPLPTDFVIGDPVLRGQVADGLRRVAARKRELRDRDDTPINPGLNPR